VEVIQSKVRRERLGHIKLAAPVAHIWFLKSLPSKIGAVLDMTLKQLEKILYFEQYAVISVAEEARGSLPVGTLLSEEKYRQALEEHPGKFEVGIGAEAIRLLLASLSDRMSETEKAELKTRIDAQSSGLLGGSLDSFLAKIDKEHLTRMEGL
ncbi:MAG: hypothetical protein V2I32_04545, partial [Desulforhopalus sp.]|jgi:DNA-directed RNA polymerase subunit beta'|nr:hypothetical protein [Desulforhopalus sp.]